MPVNFLKDFVWLQSNVDFLRAVVENYLNDF